MENKQVEDGEYLRGRCVDFGRRNFELRVKLKASKYSQYNYMALALIGWGLFVASAAGWLPK